MEKSLCPQCGNKYFTMTFECTLKMLPNNTTKVEQRDPHQRSRKKLRREHFVGMERNKDGKLMLKERLIDKDSDVYYEFVKDPETGEVVRHCYESLKEHLNHGSAKKS
jgi:uncharacterized OB-fold protein